MEVGISLAFLAAAAFLADLAVLRICRSLKRPSILALAIPLFLGITLTALGPNRMVRGVAYGLILGGLVALATISRESVLRRR